MTQGLVNLIDRHWLVRLKRSWIWKETIIFLKSTIKTCNLRVFIFFSLVKLNGGRDLTKTLTVRPQIQSEEILTFFLLL